MTKCWELLLSWSTSHYLSTTRFLMQADLCLACGTSALIWWLEWRVPTYHVRGIAASTHIMIAALHE